MAFLILCLISQNSLQADWSSSKILADTEAANLKVCLDASGNAISIWEWFDGRNTHIQTAKLAKGGSWTAATTISSFPGDYFAFPSLAVDPSGNAVAVWQERIGTLSIVKASAMREGNSWSNPVIISDPMHSSYNQRVRIDQSGNAIAIWVKDDSSSVIQCAILPFQGVWSEPMNLSDPKLTAHTPQIAVNPAGNVVVVWKIKELEMVQSSTLSFGGNWSKPLIITEGTNQIFMPQIAIDNNGNAVAVWVELQKDVQGLVIKAATLPFHGTWTEPVVISATPSEAMTRFPFAMDAKGNGIILWGSTKGASNDLQAAAYHYDGFWSEPVLISSISQWASFAQVVLAVSANGSALALWSTGGNQAVIQASRLLSEGNWSPPISFPGTNPELQCVAIDPTGYAIGCWIDEGATMYAVWTPTIEEL